LHKNPRMKSDNDLISASLAGPAGNGMVPFCIGHPIPYSRLPQIPTENRITGKRKTEKYDSRKRKSLSPALFFPPFFGRNS
ncbi:hypothetical protein, partial [uncultured Dialister sp.]|uniref:hypothetical protein n=1 Tax=uncultured Dialister sp. TaxID=278064 RepID=UPI0025F8A74C